MELENAIPTASRRNMQNGGQDGARDGTTGRHASGGVGDLEAPGEGSDGWYKQWWRRTDSEVRSDRQGGSFSRRRSVLAYSKKSAIFAWEGFESIKLKTSRGIDRMNEWGERSWVGRFFTFRDRKARLGKELQAGLISFLMIAYTLTVNPTILSTTGGTCDAKALCGPELYNTFGDSCLQVSTADDVLDCLVSFKRSVTTATAVASLIGSFLMGFFANLPMGLAPGIGINVYFAYQVVGQGVLTYQQALVAIFIEGWIFIVLSLTGVRGAVMKYMPRSIAFSGSVGMGLLLAYTGLRSLGVIAFDPTTLTTLGGCPRDHQKFVFYSAIDAADLINRSAVLEGDGEVIGLEYNGSFINFPINDIDFASPSVHACASHEMQSATMWLGIAGGIISSLLLVWRVKGALFYGVAFVTIIAWIPGHAASYLGKGSSIPGGAYRLQSFEQIVAVPSLSMSGLNWDWSAISNGHFWVVLFTFLYIDILDCTGILLSMALLLDKCMELDFYDVDEQDEIVKKKEAIKEANNGIEPNPYQQFVSQKKEFKGQQWAFLSDGIGILVSSMVGISPVNVYLENAAGIEDGGRTGIVPLMVSFFFFIALFFSPILSSIPPYATGGALMLVGIMLMAHADHIPWDEPKEAIPAFLTIIVMPFSYSVAYGILAGLCMYIILRIPEWIIKLFQKAKARLKGNHQSMDETASVGSSKRSGKPGRRHLRKFFGDVPFGGSDIDTHSNMGVGSDAFMGRERGVTTTDSIAIPGGRQLTHSQSHAGFGLQSWDGRSGRLSSSPVRGGMLSSPANRPTWARSMSGMDRLPAQPKGRPQGLNFPTLNNSMKRSSSFVALDDQANASAASVDGESGPALFGNFQLLDLDLGGSGSSEDEDEIMLKNDGTLSLVSRKSLQRDSADMTMFKRASGQGRGSTSDMETIAEAPGPGQTPHVHDGSSDDASGSNRRITFTMVDDDEANLEASMSRIPSRHETRSLASNSSLASGGLSRSFGRSGSISGRGMVRTESAAALRLKDLFAAANQDPDLGDNSAQSEDEDFKDHDRRSGK